MKKFSTCQTQQHASDLPDTPGPRSCFRTAIQVRLRRLRLPMVRSWCMNVKVLSSSGAGSAAIVQ